MKKAYGRQRPVWRRYPGSLQVGLLLILVLFTLSLLAVGHNITDDGLLPVDCDEWDMPPFETVCNEDDQFSIWLFGGTNQLGGYYLTDLIRGTEYMFYPGLLALVLTLVIAIPLGTWVGYNGESRQTYGRGYSIYRYYRIFHNALDAFPRFTVVILCYAIFEEISIYYGMLAFGILNIPKFSEIIRSKIQRLKEKDFIQASRAFGFSDRYILGKLLLYDNCRRVILVMVTFTMSEAVILETTLTYLIKVGGFGSWGTMIRNTIHFHSIYDASILPAYLAGGCIVLAVLSFNLLGDGLAKLWNIKQETV